VVLPAAPPIIPNESALPESSLPTADLAAKPAVPFWAYLFAIGCGAIPIMSLGGLIPGLIGGSGVYGYIAVSRLHQLDVSVRLILCAGIVIGCWFLTVTVLGSLALTLR
jgi:hypothetical protein